MKIVCNTGAQRRVLCRPGLVALRACLILMLSAGHAGSADWIVDNADEGFAAVGDWRPSTRDPGYIGENYLWHPAGTGAARATWRTPVPRPGWYNVYARWVFSKPDDRAADAPFTVAAADRFHTVRVNMREPQFAAEHPAGRVQSPFLPRSRRLVPGRLLRFPADLSQ